MSAGEIKKRIKASFYVFPRYQISLRELNWQATPLASRVPLSGNIAQIGFDFMMSVS